MYCRHCEPGKRDCCTAGDCTNCTAVGGCCLLEVGTSVQCTESVQCTLIDLKDVFIDLSSEATFSKVRLKPK